MFNTAGGGSSRGTISEYDVHLPYGFNVLVSGNSVKPSEDSQGKEHPKKYRTYQEKSWYKRYGELLTFRKIYNHCFVPNSYPANPELARWVKRQRYQYNLFTQGKSSSITIERITKLEYISFVWDAHEALWHERVKDLIQFKKEYGHCEVPTRYQPNIQLATWVKSQRRQYKLYCDNNPSNMSAERAMELNKHGFQWEIRNPKLGKETRTLSKQSNILVTKHPTSLDSSTQTKFSETLSKFTQNENRTLLKQNNILDTNQRPTSVDSSSQTKLSATLPKFTQHENQSNLNLLLLERLISWNMALRSSANEFTYLQPRR